MTMVECPCGKARMTYEVVGEDNWYGTAANTRLVANNDTWGKDCICKACGAIYDGFDPCMVTVTEGGEG